MIDHSKFDFIEDLPISEEMIGAYLEGNLVGSEMRDIQNLISEDYLISNIIDEVEVSNPLDLNFASEFTPANNVEMGLNDIDTPFELPAIEIQATTNYLSEAIVTEVISSNGEDSVPISFDSQNLDPLSSNSDSMGDL